MRPATTEALDLYLVLRRTTGDLLSDLGLRRKSEVAACSTEHSAWPDAWQSFAAAPKEWPKNLLIEIWSPASGRDPIRVRAAELSPAMSTDGLYFRPWKADR